jgi:hypothetical protein
MIKEFCKNAKCAKITIFPEGGQPIIITSKCPSIAVQEFYKRDKIFTHPMTSPIEETFDFLIEDVLLIEGHWFLNTAEGNTAGTIKLSCPMPGTYPIRDEGGVGFPITDLYWDKNKLFCYFDGIDDSHRVTNYPNNRGSCTYKVLGGKCYKFSDRQGLLHQTKPIEKATYQIECDACCKDTEILCDHHKYPGYKCYPIPPISSQLANNRYDISRLFE